MQRNPPDAATPPPDSPSLDPADWEAFRASCHRAVDDAIAYLSSARERPVWRAVPEPVKSALRGPAPRSPQSLDAVYGEFLEQVLPYALGNTHPRFFGWVHGTGTPGGALAEFLAGVMNANVGGRDHIAVYVERQVLSWCKSIFGLPETAGGILVSGTSMATLLALTVARNEAADGDVRERGVPGACDRLRLYTSEESHHSVTKAMEVLGLGRERVRRVPVRDDLSMDVAALARMVAEDRAAGLQPFCAVGTAGTVNTAAMDDLEAIADVCAREGLWFHVDGAFGGLAVLSREQAHLVKGVERADSVAFDFHKWLHVPYDAGCLLVRDGEAHFRTFAAQVSYLTQAERGLAGGAPWFTDFGVELSRGFRALKVWFTLKEHGLERLGEKISDNCGQAQHLARLVQARPELELMASVALNIVCFRYVPSGDAAADVNVLNGAIIRTLHEDGTAAPSLTKIGGSTAIRVNITNHRTVLADMDLLVEAVVAAGDRLTQAGEGSLGGRSPLDAEALDADGPPVAVTPANPDR